MRSYSRYLETIKSEVITAQFNLAGSTPPRSPALEVLTAKGLGCADAETKLRPSVLELLSKKTGEPTTRLTVCPGSSQALAQILSAVTAHGDSILIERPTYEPFEATAKFLGLKVRFFRRTGDFTKDLRAIQRMAKSCKIALISNPHCPTGHLYDRAQLKTIAKVIQLIVDEVYLPLFSKGQSFTLSSPGMIAMGGLSKSVGASNARVGWVIAPPKTIRDVTRIGLNLHVDMPAPSLKVMKACLENWDELLEQNITLADQNRARVLAFAKANPDAIPWGFDHGYVFVLRVPKNFDSGRAFARALLKQSVWVRAGEDFFLDGFVRIHVLIPSQDFEVAFGQIETFYNGIAAPR